MDNILFTIWEYFYLIEQHWTHTHIPKLTLWLSEKHNSTVNHHKVLLSAPIYLHIRTAGLELKDISMQLSLPVIFRSMLCQPTEKSYLIVLLFIFWCEAEKSEYKEFISVCVCVCVLGVAVGSCSPESFRLASVPPWGKTRLSNYVEHSLTFLIKTTYVLSLLIAPYYYPLPPHYPTSTTVFGWDSMLICIGTHCVLNVSLFWLFWF